MAEAIVYGILEELSKIIGQETAQEMRLVVGVRDEVQRLTDSLQTIGAVLVDAEKRQETDEVVKVWLDKLKDICYDMNDVLDDWGTAILKAQIKEAENATSRKKKVCSYLLSPCFCFNLFFHRRDIGWKIKKLNKRLDLIAFEKDRYHFRLYTNTEEVERQRTTPFVNVSAVWGREQDKETVINKLLCETSIEERCFHVVSVIGMAGIGKTTLAQLAYNADSVKAHFEKKIWVCVSNPFDKVRIFEEIARALDASLPATLDWKILPQRINDQIAEKKFLLVLDDVWTEDFINWEPLEHCLKTGVQGSRILVTTRNERVAKMVGTTYMHSLDLLSKEVCQSLLCQIALFGRSVEDYNNLEEIGKIIADKCKGLPLAAKTLGSLLRFKETEEEWQTILNSEIWELEAAERGIFPPLLLSYYDLPSALKRCFLYCALFPQDYVIETEKLIQLWMAQGYLSSKPNIEMEIVGREYFENLVMRSFFQDFKKDGSGRIASCKMHNIVHEFAQFLAKNESFVMEVGGGEELSTNLSNKKGHHLTVMFAAQAPFPVSIYSRENLHTLLVLHKVTTRIDDDLPDLLQHFTHLRALDLSKKKILVLSGEVGKLIHLRYLNLSHNGFEELPETVSDLCNLQTLDLNCCLNLKELPAGMGKLIKLRHLIIHITKELRFLPTGIGRLSSLRMLSKFVVSGSADRDACKLGALKNMNLLQGRLTIDGLGYLADVGEAERAELKSKTHLFGLVLNFYRCSGSAEGEGKMDDVLAALEPQPNLELVAVWYYNGTLFPSWMLSLAKLKKLKLCNWGNCTSLPPLGKLPSLESLKIFGMERLKNVGIEFLGLGIDGTVTAFPKLKRLKFEGMEQWEEWDVMITRRGKEEEEDITIMPCLCSLTIWDCPKLKALPHLLQTMPLQKLDISWSPILTQRCQKGSGEDWTKISHIPNIQIYE